MAMVPSTLVKANRLEQTAPEECAGKQAPRPLTANPLSRYVGEGGRRPGEGPFCVRAPHPSPLRADTFSRATGEGAHST
jgi:hypothetical protein